MKGGDVSFVVGLTRGAQCRVPTELSCAPAGTCCVSCSPASVRRGVLWPQVCISVIKRGYQKPHG